MAKDMEKEKNMKNFFLNIYYSKVNIKMEKDIKEKNIMEMAI